VPTTHLQDHRDRASASVEERRRLPRCGRRRDGAQALAVRPVLGVLAATRRCKGTKKIVTGKTSPNTPSGVACPECGEGELGGRSARAAGPLVLGCNRYPKCKLTIPAKPVARACPTCGHPFVLERTSVKRGTTWSCPARGLRLQAGRGGVGTWFVDRGSWFEGSQE